MDIDESNNTVVKTWGEPRPASGVTADGVSYQLHSHYDLVQLADVALLPEGQAVAGGRGFFLKNEGVFLN